MVKYTMKAGMLYKDGEMKAQLRGTFADPAKCILRADGSVAFRTAVQEKNTEKEHTGDVCCRRYVVVDGDGRECAAAQPYYYASGSDPCVEEWPVCRTQKAGCAKFLCDGRAYTLKMCSERQYLLTEQTGDAVIEIMHRGVCGGWNIEAKEEFSPEMICAVFILCRYLEKENEFMIL